jgi:hypothetical protein
VSNIDNPNGLQPLMRALNGGDIETERYQKVGTLARAIRKHDPVTLLATGYLDVGAGITPGTTLYLGVALNYAAASVLSDHDVIINPLAFYEAQDDDDTVGLVFADRGQNANLLLTDGGTPTLQDSAVEIDQSTHDVTNSLDVHLVKLVDRIDNAYGPWSRWEIVFNKHFYAGVTAGI